MHTRRAVALNRPARHFGTASKPQGRHPAGIDFIGMDVDTAKNDVVEFGRVERLAQQQGTACLYREIHRCEQTWFALCLDKRRAGAIDNVDRAAFCGAA